MSYKVSRWVKENSPVRGAARRLLEEMAWRVHDDCVFWMKNAQLAKLMGCTVRSIQRQTSALEACGAIEKIHQASPDQSGRQINNLYRVLTPGYAVPDPRLRAGNELRLTVPADFNTGLARPAIERPDPRLRAGNELRLTVPAEVCTNLWKSGLARPETVTLPLTKLSPSPRQNCHPPKEQTTLKTTTSNHRAAASSLQASLSLIGAVPQARPATFEDLAALRGDVEELVELTGETFERWLERVSDGSATGRARFPPAVRVEGMNAERVVRCRRDARLWRNQLRKRGFGRDEFTTAQDRAARRTA